MAKYVIVANELYDYSKQEKYVLEVKGNVATYTLDVNEAKLFTDRRVARLAADLLNVKINGYTFTPKFIGG